MRYIALLYKEDRLVRGFALVEAIISTLLVAVLAFSLFAFFPPYKTFVERYNRQLIASNFACERMENIYWNLDIPVGSSSPETLSYPVPNTGFSSFTRSYQVDNDPTASYRIIKVKVDID